jgi:hypothetical protein
MSDSNICSNDEMYGGFGVMMCNLLRHQDDACACRWEEECAASARRAVAAASTTPAPATATVAAAHAPGTNYSLPVPVTERTYLTKHPYKRQKRAAKPDAVPAPAVAPAPAPLVGVDGAGTCAPAEKKPPLSFLLRPL